MILVASDHLDVRFPYWVTIELPPQKTNGKTPIPNLFPSHAAQSSDLLSSSFSSHLRTTFLSLAAVRSALFPCSIHIPRSPPPTEPTDFPLPPRHLTQHYAKPRHASHTLSEGSDPLRPYTLSSRGRQLSVTFCNRTIECQHTKFGVIKLDPRKSRF